LIIGSGGSAFVDGGIGAIHALDVFEIGLKNGSVLSRDDVPLAKNIEQIEYMKLKEGHS
jgi:glycerate kinase